MTWHPIPGADAVFTDVRIPTAALEGVSHISDGTYTVVKNDYASWTTLRQRGLVLPAPFGTYEFKGRHRPRQHQRDGAEFLISNQKALLNHGLGSGKTLTSLWAMDYLFSQGAIKRVLIVGPVSVIGHVWPRELFITFPHLRALHISGDARRKTLIANDDADIFLVNYESLHIVQDKKYDLVIADESVKLKNPGTKAWKLLNHIAQNTRLWLLTGLPTPQGPMDALGNIKLLRGPQAMTKTRWQMMTMRQITQFKWVPLPDAATTVAKWLTPAHCVKSEDCYDVPDMEIIELEYDLTAEQKALCSELAKEARAELNGKTITATNAAHVLTKLLQAQAGGVYGEEKAPHVVPADGFFDALTDLVEAADTPVLVFASYRINAEAIARHLQSNGLDTVMVHGDTTQTERREAFNAVERRTVRALVAVPSTMSHGIDNLVSARFMVWAQCPFSFDIYGQSVARLVRQGQKNAVKVYHMIGSKVVRGLFARLAEKDRLQDAVLDLIGTIE